VICFTRRPLYPLGAEPLICTKFITVSKYQYRHNHDDDAELSDYLFKQQQSFPECLLNVISHSWCIPGKATAAPPVSYTNTSPLFARYDRVHSHLVPKILRTRQIVLLLPFPPFMLYRQFCYEACFVNANWV
jgi:hypothetical protein